MPEICRFYGSIIAMFFEDHDPPHFHARYGKHKVAVRIEDCGILEEHLPSRVLALVMEWASQHQGELLSNWALVKANQPPMKIEPLE